MYSLITSALQWAVQFSGGACNVECIWIYSFSWSRVKVCSMSINNIHVFPSTYKGKVFILSKIIELKINVWIFYV